MPSFHRAACVLNLAAPLIFALVAGRASAAEEKPNPIVVRVKAALKDPDKPFTLIVHLNVKEGEGKKLEAAFAKAIKPTRKEKGCLAYYLNQDAKNPQHYLVYEHWKNLAALEAHLKTSHIRALLGTAGDLLDMPPKADIFLAVGD